MSARGDLDCSPRLRAALAFPPDQIFEEYPDSASKTAAAFGQRAEALSLAQDERQDVETELHRFADLALVGVIRERIDVHHLLFDRFCFVPMSRAREPQ